MKKFLLLFFFSILALAIILNYRVPFFRQCGGPWSISFGESSHFPDDIPVKENAIYSMNELKQLNDSTQFLADPFFIKEKDTLYLFVEHKKINPHAQIAVLTSTDGKNYHYRGIVLKQPFHLSYPQVFKYRNEHYMIPESKGANAILLYKAYHFPFDWRICDTLVKNVQFKDPTVFLSDTLNIMVASDDHLNMYMYEADSLLGKWKLHKHPLVISGSEARGGGRIIANKKGLILPIQNGSNGYGYGLSLYQLEFRDGNYTIDRIKPFFLHPHADIKAFNAGMHQFDMQRIGNKYYYVYDGNCLTSSNKRWNLKASLKMNSLDLKNWFTHILK